VSLKAALLCSLLIHVGLLATRPPVDRVPPRSSPEVLEVTYLPISLEKGSTAIPKRKGSAAVPLRKGAISVSKQKEASAAPVFVERKKTPSPLKGALAPLKGSTPPPPKISRSQPAPEPARPTVQSAPAGSPSPDQTLAKISPAAASIPGGEFALVTHKEQVREHLKEHLKYPVFWVQGSVQLRLDLDQNGALRQAVIVKTSDSRLSEEALRRAKSAAPFPAFPKALRKRQIRYDFLVQYRRD